MASALPLLALPIAAMVAIASIVFRFLEPGARLSAFTLSIAVAAIWGAAIILLRFDPIGVGTWWMD